MTGATDRGPVTYRCPIPDCGWAVTDDQRETLAGVVMLKLAARQGVPEEMVQEQWEARHRRELSDLIGQHLATHQLAEPQQQWLTERIIRAAITPGEPAGPDQTGGTCPD